MISWRGFRRYRSSQFHNRRTRRTRKYKGLTVKDILSFLGSLTLPLMLGTFTVIITFGQKDLAGKQRLEDRRLAEEQRDQDLNISHEQRREDRELSREQRLQDLNQSRLQRELERTLADETRNIGEGETADLKTSKDFKRLQKTSGNFHGLQPQRLPIFERLHET